MIVDKKIELEIKLLKDFPEWNFLPDDDLNRKTIEIFFDLNLAKRSCNKEQKVLKVTNTEVFRIAAPILIEKGISRIVCPNNLIALWAIFIHYLYLKLEPTIKLIGSSIVSLTNKSILLVLELFCIPINKITNKQELKIADNNNFLIKTLI